MLIRIALAVCAVCSLPSESAHALSVPRAIELIQFCADSASSQAAIPNHARRERWWRLDRDTLENIRTSSRLTAEAEMGWLVDREGAILLLTNQNDRLLALGDPLEEGRATLPTQACTIIATGADGAQIRRDVESVQLFDLPVGAPTSQLDLESGRALSQWVVRSGQGDVAYIFAQFGPGAAIVEVGRVVSDR